MNNRNNDATHKPTTRLPFKPCGFPAAGERLIRDGLIAPEAYGQMFDSETATWEEILAMDEATLDTELGMVDVAAINRASTTYTMLGRLPAGFGGPLRDVMPIQPALRQATYRHHYQMRLAGVRDGLIASRREIEAELKEVQRLLMATAGGFLFDVFKNLGRYLSNGRLLLVEKMVNGEFRLEGCVAFDHQDLDCLSGPDGLVRRRVNVIRLLAARDSEHRALLARRLSYEAQLRGTVRAMRPGYGPACIGTLGVVPEVNTRALKWATLLDHRARVLASWSKAVSNDPVLAAFRDKVEEAPRAGRNSPYYLVVADRMQLLEAARLHVAGIGPVERREDETDLRLDYEANDPCALQVFKAATDLHSRDPEALRLFGLDGPHNATIWGPPPAPDMGFPAASPRGAETLA